MRKNKFRAWDKKNKKMHIGHVLNGIMSYSNYDIPGYALSFYDTNTDVDQDDLDNLIWMQYIGSEDLNNKEAYEDDLIRYRYYHENGEKVIGIAKIYFDGGCYFLEDVKTKYKYPMYLASLSFEIIGNIHENKDLLKL